MLAHLQNCLDKFVEKYDRITPLSKKLVGIGLQPIPTHYSRKILTCLLGSFPYE